MLLLIDNYDSFTYNLSQALSALGAEVRVVRNDEAPLSALAAMKPSHVVISPGPGRPAEAGISLAAVRHFSGRVPLLGVCLGHQALAQAFGGEVAPARRLMHGKTSAIRHDGRGLFAGLPQPLVATRYHSLAVTRTSLPETFAVTAWTADGEIMALYHAPTGACGVQFHPESILTEAGPLLLAAFLRC
ncbi:MAG: aminodeoxychorismate/anthranilate synthase component II [Deltaproteobacteria bacterium]|nr:aminodeoxychorismate/anthranilate synthase component II [Deltaproteobacteria bacterium]